MQRPALTCLLIADDLTGACDAGVQFANRGCETAVRLWGSLDSTAPAEKRGGGPGWIRAAQGACPTLAISTESRTLPAHCLPGVFAEAARRFPGARLIFKKIDSTLRGNVGAEVALAAEAFRCETAVITPAFPAMGRTVVEGVLRVCAVGIPVQNAAPKRAGSLEEPTPPIGMAAYWREQNLRSCVHMGCAELPYALAAGARFVSLDACCDEDLDSIAAAGLASDRRILWAGSAGLAAALARALWRQRFRATASLSSGASTPVLFCVGSNHAVTMEQERRLIAERPSLAANAETADVAEISSALESGRHVALRVPCGRVSVERLASLIGGVRAPILATGGFTASLVWRALGLRAMRLEAEIFPGIPLGVISGGVRDGAPLVTKSGGFGTPGALIEIADYFCPL